MMLSHPVLLGIVWSLLSLSTSGQAQISNTDSNKVYAYSYHFQHNGSTSSKDILRSVFGTDPELGLDLSDEKSIVKTFSSPDIRGFFTRGVLPAGPISHSFNSGFNSPYSDIKRIVESNLHPPQNFATGILPPVAPEISNEFPRNINDVGNVFSDNFPKVPIVPSNNGNRNVEDFSKDTPDGGKIIGRVETFSYNPPPVSQARSTFQENSEGYRRNENILNNNQEVTGHRTQSFFRQQFRTVTPNLESNDYGQGNGIGEVSGNRNRNNQWWNALSVLGNKREPQLQNHGMNQDVSKNINEIRENINRAFGARLSGFRGQRDNTGFNVDNNLHNIRNRIGVNNHGINVNNVLPDINRNNIPSNNNGFINAPVNGGYHSRNDFSNAPFRNPINSRFDTNVNNIIVPHQVQNNFPSNPNSNRQFQDDTEKKVMNLIHDVNSRLSNLQNNGNFRPNNIERNWEGDLPNVFNNNDWSSRTRNVNRPFSNAHSGPVKTSPVDILKSTLNMLSGNRNHQHPGNHQDSYSNVDGGGVEKLFNVDKTIEGPNSISRNQQRRYERNFNVNSNSGYSTSNQWSTNNVRRLDAQSSKTDFNKDFIDVFREDY